MDEARARRPYLALRHREFRKLWIAQLVSLTGSQMQVVAINWHVYLLTRSPLALGFVGLTRVLPIIVFSLWGGIVADRRDRRWVMFNTQLAMTAVAAGLAVLTFTGSDAIWWIYALNALAAAAVAFDGPARQALVPRLVPPEDLPGALSLNLTVFHGAMIGGPALAGLLIAGTGALLAPGTTIGGRLAHAGSSELSRHTAGLGWIYLINALSFVAVLASLLSMHPATGRLSPERSGPDHPLLALKEGLQFVFRTPLMVWSMALDFFATFFSGSMSLLPIFADQILMVGPAGYGLLAAAPALGALAGSLYTSIWPLPRKQGRVFLWSVAAYGLATIVYGVSRSYALTFLALAGTGLADLVSTVIRQTLRQLITRDELRGRMTSINMIFFMGGPQLGELEAGLVASIFSTAALGAAVSVVSGGIATLAVVAFVAAATPVVRGYDLTRHLPEHNRQASAG
ncbi:MAG: MFS transporter [Acidobacteria bacterium]|nr:MAG: MFS transporter [Acidobacteriota bacterium]